jgi:hypothetical protein
LIPTIIPAEMGFSTKDWRKNQLKSKT